jgi:alginate O-acetyltransferase complex protein AlgI
MNFVSWQFFVFLAVFFIIFFLLPRKFQWISLLAANVVFYVFAGWQYALFQLFTIASTYLCALWMGARYSKRDRRIEQGFDTKDAKRAYKNHVEKGNHWICVLGVVLNLAVLFLLKYYNFFGTTLFSWFGKAASFPRLNLLLPIGISFYTFSSLGYLIDVYREMFGAEKNPLKFTAVISFFPVVLQGPICSYQELSTQIVTGFEFSSTNAWAGFKRMVLGFLKKIVIADLLGVAVSSIWSNYASESGFVFFVGTIFMRSSFMPILVVIWTFLLVSALLWALLCLKTLNFPIYLIPSANFGGFGTLLWERGSATIFITH